MDGTVCAGIPTFLQREERCSFKFPSKPKEFDAKPSAKFDGIEISTENGSEVMIQASYIANI